MGDQGQIDEKIKQELRSLEAPYNEGDWQEFEPYINSLQPPSAFKLNKKTVLVIVLFFVLGTSLYFAIPVFKRLQISSPEQKQEEIEKDTGTTDPDHKPDTIISAPPVVTPPPVTVDSAAIKMREDSINAVTHPKPIKTLDPVITPVPKAPKKRKVAPTDTLKTKPVQEEEIEENILLRKEVPITKEPQGDPRIEDGSEKKPEIQLQTP